MILADQQHLQTHTKRLAVELREKDVKLFVEHLQTMGTLSSLLCGVGFGCLFQKPSYRCSVDNEYGFRDDFESIETLYLFSASMCIICNLLVKAIAAYSSIYGIDLAARGSLDKSMSRAAIGLYHERRTTVRLFLAGIIFTSTSGILLIWTKLQLMPRFFSVAAFCFFFVYVFWIVRKRVYSKFHFDGIDLPPTIFLLGDGRFDPEHGLI